ncbi:hypothetical protein D1156_11500 [Neglecta sp. X58]|nr:hypothetical protein [Neglectibacter sp. X58]
MPLRSCAGRAALRPAGTASHFILCAPPSFVRFFEAFFRKRDSLPPGPPGKFFSQEKKIVKNPIFL